MGQISILSLSHKVNASCTTSEMSLSKVAIRRNNSGLTSISIKMSLSLALCACLNSENENLKAILRMAKYSKEKLNLGLELKPTNKLAEHSGRYARHEPCASFYIPRLISISTAFFTKQVHFSSNTFDSRALSSSSGLVRSYPMSSLQKGLLNSLSNCS